MGQDLRVPIFTPRKPQKRAIFIDFDPKKGGFLDPPRKNEQKIATKPALIFEKVKNQGGSLGLNTPRIDPPFGPPKMAQNGQKWPKTVKNGPKWSKMAKNR